MGYDNEIWPIILEKAHSKVHGSFQAIEAGWANEAWADLTGAPGHLDKTPEVSFEVLHNAIK